jgi:hypothetical protein
MRDIMMTVGGDLVVTEFGDIAVVYDDNDDIIQMANNNILTRLGENIFHPEIGNDVDKVDDVDFVNKYLTLGV